MYPTMSRRGYTHSMYITQYVYVITYSRETLRCLRCYTCIRGGTDETDTKRYSVTALQGVTPVTLVTV